MLQVVLFFIGIVGLLKRKIKISSKREINGAPVIYLSIFYLLVAIVSLLWNLDLLIIGVVAIVTILVVIFAKGRPVSRL